MTMPTWNQKHRDQGMLEERRKKAVQMVIGGAPKTDVAKEVGASLTSVKDWYRAYLKGGRTLDTLDSKRHTGRPPRLDGKQLDRLGNMLLNGVEHHGYEVDPWTTERVPALIEEKFGMKYNPDYVWRILQLLDFSS